MKILKYLLVGLLIPNLCIGQTQIGQDLLGDSENEWFGYSTSISSDGQIIAVGTNKIGEGQSKAKVFKLIGNRWKQLGDDFLSNHDYGMHVSLSGQGNRVIIGQSIRGDNSPDSSIVQVYEWSNQNWIQIGEFITIDNDFGLYGPRVKFSKNGKRIIIGYPHYSNLDSSAGKVQVFEFTGTSWIQVGQNLIGESFLGYYGKGIDISEHGDHIIIGAYGENKVYCYQLVNNNWELKGEIIEAGMDSIRFGYEVDISNSGEIITIGSPWFQNDNFDYVGKIQRYIWDETKWQKDGNALIGDYDRDIFGYSYSVSENGEIISVGVFYSDFPYYSSGHVKVFRFENDSWKKILNDIPGENEVDLFGISVSLSGAGNILGIGSTHNDDNGNLAGKVKVYSLEESVANGNTLNIKKLDIGPNPTNGLIYINGNYSELKFFNINGQIINKFYESSSIVDISNLENGIYILEINQQDSVFRKSIIKL